MNAITQYRIAGMEDGEAWSTKWFGTQSEALDSKWINHTGAKLETREHVEMALPEHLAMQRQGATIIRASKYEIGRRMEVAHKAGKAFAAHRITATIYRIMEMEIA